MIPGFVTVRTSSTRLPAKCLLPFGDGNVLEHVIRRARAFGIEPIVCTSIDSSDDLIEKIAGTEGVCCFRGSLSKNTAQLITLIVRSNLWMVRRRIIQAAAG